MDKTKCQRGQAAVEYLLLLLAAFLIISSLSGLLQERFLGVGPCPNEGLLCKIQGQVFGNSSEEGHFQSFRLIR